MTGLILVSIFESLKFLVLIFSLFFVNELNLFIFLSINFILIFTSIISIAGLLVEADTYSILIGYFAISFLGFILAFASAIIGKSTFLGNKTYVSIIATCFILITFFVLITIILYPLRS